MLSTKWRLILAVVFVVLSTTGGLSGVVARSDGELDVAAIPLVPEDVDEPGFGLLGGMLIASVDEAAQIAASNRGGASPENVAEFAGILEDVGWQRDYLVGLGLPDEDNPDTYEVLIDSGVEEYADADGAGESFEIFGDPDAFTSVEAEEVRRAPRIADEARMVQFTGEVPEANLSFQGLSIQFRVDNLVAYVTVYDYAGGAPEADTVEELARRLLERVEAVRAADEPGTSAAVLRLPGDSLAESRENYVRLAGETIPYFGEAADAQASRDEQYADVSDIYVLSQQVATGEEDPADDLRYVVFLHRFGNERAASRWMETERERLDLTAEDAPFLIPEAEGIGEESFAYETLPDRDTALESRYVLYTRAGADVAIMDLSAGSDVSFDALTDLAETQVDCLEAGACPDPASLPEELGVDATITE